jgi:hypothetical protein
MNKKYNVFYSSKKQGLGQLIVLVFDLIFVLKIVPHGFSI